MSARTLLGLVLLAAPAWALPPVSLSLGYSAQVFSSRQYDLVATDDTLQQFRAGAGYALPVWRGFLDLELAFSTGATGAQSHGGIAATLVLRGVGLDVGFRLPVFRHFHPYVLVGGGYDWASLTLFDTSRLTQTVGTLGGKAMLGAQVPFKLGPADSRAPTLLFDVGLGYVGRPNAPFHAMAPAPTGARGDEPPIARAGTDLGSLPLSGITYRVLLTIRL